AQLDLNALAIDVAECFQPPAKCLQFRRLVGWVGPHQEADAGNSHLLLRDSRNRPGERCAAQSSDELAAPHSMTSLARARIDGGRHLQSEGPGGLEIAGRLDCRRLREGQIAGLLTLEDPPSENAALGPSAGKARSIADQPAGSDEFPRKVDRWYRIASRQ